MDVMGMVGNLTSGSMGKRDDEGGNRDSDTHDVEAGENRLPDAAAIGAEHVTRLIRLLLVSRLLPVLLFLAALIGAVLPLLDILEPLHNLRQRDLCLLIDARLLFLLLLHALQRLDELDVERIRGDSLLALALTLAWLLVLLHGHGWLTHSVLGFNGAFVPSGSHRRYTAFVTSALTRIVPLSTVVSTPPVSFTFTSYTRRTAYPVGSVSVSAGTTVVVRTPGVVALPAVVMAMLPPVMVF